MKFKIKVSEFNYINRDRLNKLINLSIEKNSEWIKYLVLACQIKLTKLRLLSLEYS
jgi:hypothetical protein